MKNFLRTFLTAMLIATSAYAGPDAGTVRNGQGPSLDPVDTAAPVLGVNAVTNGTLGLANGGTNGVTITLKNTGATTAYNYNFPTTAGTSGDILTSGGGSSTANTWTTSTGTGNVVKSASPTFTGTIGAASETLSGTLIVTGATTASGGVDGVLGGVTPAAVTATTVAGTVVSGSTSVSSPIVNVGSSGAAGTANVFPATASKGKIIFSAINNTGNFNTTITNSDSGQSTVWTTPDAGAATVNFVGDTNTQTISGKTLTSPKITGPVAVACGSTCTLGAANLRTWTKLDTAGGSAATLPTATGTGNRYDMYISVATTSNQDKVLLQTVTDVIIGRAVGFTGAGGASKTFDGSAGTYHSIQMPFAGSQPAGGFVSDMISCTDVASALYLCEIRYQGGTTPTTPFSTGTT